MAAATNNNTASTELEHRWDIKLAYWVERKKWLKKGWEPFAVSDGIVYFRKFRPVKPASQS